jgi:hypothetical protein
VLEEELEEVLEPAPPLYKKYLRLNNPGQFLVSNPDQILAKIGNVYPKKPYEYLVRSNLNSKFLPIFLIFIVKGIYEKYYQY